MEGYKFSGLAWCYGSKKDRRKISSCGSLLTEQTDISPLCAAEADDTDDKTYAQPYIQTCTGDACAHAPYTLTMLG